MEFAEFNALTSFAGGLLIGFSALLLYLLRGDVAGISGMVTGVMSFAKGETSWRVLFLIGLIGGGFVYQWLGGNLTRLEPAASGWAVVLAGLLVGIGASFASGCTSGHGICGIARFSNRSLVATGVFLSTAIITVFITQHVIGV